MNQKILFSLLFLAGFVQLWAQKEPVGGVRIRLSASTKQIEKAEGYKKAYQSLSPKLVYSYLNQEGKEVQGKTYPTKYDEDCDCWANYYLPYGSFKVVVHSVGFKRIEYPVVVNAPIMNIEEKLNVDSIPYSYRNGERYNYTRGQVAFSQTLVVFFNTDDIEKNLKLLEKLVPEGFVRQAPKAGRLIEPRAAYAANHFYITIPVPESLTGVGELLKEQEYGEPRPFYGYMIGDLINSYVEKLQAEETIELVEPTYFDAVPESAFLDPEKTPKTEAYKQRIRRRLYEGG